MRVQAGAQYCMMRQVPSCNHRIPAACCRNQEWVLRTALNVPQEWVLCVQRCTYRMRSVLQCTCQGAVPRSCLLRVPPPSQTRVVAAPWPPAAREGTQHLMGCQCRIDSLQHNYLKHSGTCLWPASTLTADSHICSSAEAAIAYVLDDCAGQTA